MINYDGNNDLGASNVLFYAFRDIAARALAQAINDGAAKALARSLKDVMEEAYLAGIFDGEGCVTESHGKWTVVVSNTHPHTLERFRERFGGSICEQRPAKEQHAVCYRWVGSGRVAERMAIALLPFLEIKRGVVESGRRVNWGLARDICYPEKE